MTEVVKTNHVVYSSANGQIIDIFYAREPGWRHHNFGMKNNAPPASGNPTAFVDKVDNSQNIVYRGQDGNIHVLCFIRNQGWQIKNLNAMTGAPPAAGDPSTYTYHEFNTQHVIYRSGDGHVQQLYYPHGKEWKHADMTADHGAPPSAGTPTSFVDMHDNSQNFIYRGMDGHIHHVYYIREHGWTTKNLSGMTGAPTAAGDPSSYKYHVFNTQHAIYCGTDGHIHQLYYPHGKEWSHADMTAGHGATFATGNPGSFVDPVNESQNIVYRGRDGHIYTLYFIRNQGWTNLNLSQMLGTPLAAGDPYGYTFDLFQTQHVVYRGQDGNLYQLYLAPGQEWRKSNLSVDTGAPSAASDPSCYTYDLI
jgi:hypothetical protein